MKLKCLIVDDEPLAHKVILEYASEIPYLEITDQAYLPVQALEILRNKSIDLIFLDIQMPKMNGLELLRLTDSKPAVIITSAYEEFALESYELSVCDYLLKPFRFERFIQATEKALEHHKITYDNASKSSRSLLVKSDKKLVRVNMNEILYLESYGNYVKIFTEEACILTPGTLTNLEMELDDHFFKIHKSFVVNKSKIAFLEGNTITLSNQKSLPVSKNYKKGFLDFFQS